MQTPGRNDCDDSAVDNHIILAKINSCKLAMKVATANIGRLVSDGLYEEALALYARRHASFPPDAFTFPPLLKACGALRFPAVARRIHAHLVTHGLHAHPHAATALTAAYMQLRLFEDALTVFDGISQPGLPSFNAVISGFARAGRLEQLVRTFRRLGSHGLRPNSITIASVLPACTALKQGLELHGFSIKSGHGADDYVATALLTMYSNCSQPVLAQRVFDSIYDKKVASYNAMISGLVRNAAFPLALSLFKDLLVKFRPNSSTLLSLLSACSDLSALPLSKQIHCYTLKFGFGDDVKMGTALIYMYCKSNLLEQAYRVFIQMNNRNLVTWNCLISGFLCHGDIHGALDMFQQLRRQGFSPDAVTWNSMICGLSRCGNVAEAFDFFAIMQLEQGAAARPSLECLTTLLQASSSISDLRHGKEIHCHVLRAGANYEDEVFQTTLIDMYMKCGHFVHARRVFDFIDCWSNDPALWNAMISGYGRNGENDAALEILKDMLKERVKPSSATFLSSLSACSYSGQVEKGIEIFRMIKDYDVSPSIEHFGCLIDLLGRAGKLAEAWELISKIPEGSASLYSSMLGACWVYGEAELGKMICQRLSELDPSCSISPIILSNFYATTGRWKEVEILRKNMMEKELFKKPGCTWIEAKHKNFSKSGYAKKIIASCFRLANPKMG